MDKYIAAEYGISVDKIKKLNGYDNVNYHITSEGNDYIFKTYPQSQELNDIIAAENDILLRLAQNDDQKTPRPIPTKDQSYLKSVEENGQVKLCRMLSYLEGTFLGDAIHTTALFESLGHFLASLDLQLREINHYTIQARQWEWDIQYVHLNRKYLSDISDPKERNLVTYFFDQFDEVVRPILPNLRKQIIHNDANEWNLLVQNDTVSSIIDFGDLAHTFLINELAIAITYGCYDKDNPLDWAIPIIKGYHQILPLQEQELEVLYYLIAARLCTSVCNSAHAKRIDPDNVYASVSEQSAWKMLHHWLTISPVKAKNEFRKAAGFAVKEAVSVESLIERRHQHISPILSMSYKTPIHMVRSAYQYMYDGAGNTYLDAYNNIPHVGHSHPRVIQASKSQMSRLNTNTRYLYEGLAEYAEQLLSYFPPELNRVFFVNSGSAASDLAIRMANNHTGSQLQMVMELGYHGNTQIGIDISDYKFNNAKGQGQKQHIIKTTLPDTYKGKYTSAESHPGQRYGKDAVSMINESNQPISVFISEPIVGCAGQVPLPSGYLTEVYPAIRAQGGVCISDEVQTGFGRLGEYFWGFEAHAVIPDLVILGKPIANGHPMGAVVCTEAIANSFEKGVEFFSSFGGNPVSCAIASTVLDVIKEEQLQENAKTVGQYYKSQLQRLMDKHACIGDVRGNGLFLGVEIVKEHTKSPDTKLASQIKNELKKQYILVSTDGPYDNVIKTKPALCFNTLNVDRVVTTMDQILAKRLSRVW